MQIFIDNFRGYNGELYTWFESAIGLIGADITAHILVSKYNVGRPRTTAVELGGALQVSTGARSVSL